MGECWPTQQPTSRLKGQVCSLTYELVAMGADWLSL